MKNRIYNTEKLHNNAVIKRAELIFLIFSPSLTGTFCFSDALKDHSGKKPQSALFSITSREIIGCS
ncbi:MAG: hypothetical protein ABR969_04035 [Sedimentisphaerales bacterium]